MGESDSSQLPDSGTTRFFPNSELPEPLRSLDGNGLTLVVVPAVWMGLPGDRERLSVKEKGNYGERAWGEIADRLKTLYPESQEEIAMTLARVKNVHVNYLSRSQKLPPNRKTYYHNISAWEKAEGHADQVTIGTAREIIGALTNGDIKPDAFVLKRLGIVLQAMVLHDIDWDLVDSKKDARETVASLLGDDQDDLDEILHVINLVDYSRNGSQFDDSYRTLETLWGKDQARIIREIVRRNDLLQVADSGYEANKFVLATDFALRHPEFLARWGVAKPIEGVPISKDFAEFAQRIVVGDSPDPFRYYRAFFGQDQPNLAENAWKIFQKSVLER